MDWMISEVFSNPGDSHSKGNEGNWAAGGDKLTYTSSLPLGRQQVVRTALVSVF